MASHILKIESVIMIFVRLFVSRANPTILEFMHSRELFSLNARLYHKDNFNFKIMHYIIKAENKGLILKQLDLLNINESTVFPYLENSAKYISQKF